MLVLLPRPIILFAIIAISFSALAQVPQSPSKGEFEQEMERARYHQPPTLPAILSDGDKAKLARGVGADEYQNGPNSFATAEILQNAQILFASRTDDGRCLKLTIFRRSGLIRKDFEPVWSVQSAAGTNFCAPASCRPPSVWVARNSDQQSSNRDSVFIVSVPRQTSPEDRFCDNAQVVQYSYRDGKYEIAGENEQPARASFDDCYAAVDRSLMRGDEIVVIEVLPALAVKRFGISIRNVEGKLIAEKIEIPRTNVNILSSKPVLPSECKPQAVLSPVSLMIPDSQLRDFIVALNKIDLHTDRCPRTQSGDCALFADGTTLRVLVGNGPPLTLTELGGYDKIRSENPALYQWVHEVLRKADMNPR